MDKPTGELRTLHSEQEHLKDRVKVLKGAVRRLEVMANTPCGDCDEYRTMAEAMITVLADCARRGCKECNEYLDANFGDSKTGNQESSE